MTRPNENRKSHQNPEKFVIVYNADEGWAAALKDVVHKVMKPETYECSLFITSYGTVSMRREWREYLRNLPYKKYFHRRQGFARTYPVKDHPLVTNLDLPAILLERNGRLQVVLGKEKLDRLDNVTDLIAATDAVLIANGSAP